MKLKPWEAESGHCQVGNFASFRCRGGKQLVPLLQDGLYSFALHNLPLSEVLSKPKSRAWFRFWMGENRVEDRWRPIIAARLHAAPSKMS